MLVPEKRSRPEPHGRPPAQTSLVDHSSNHSPPALRCRERHDRRWWDPYQCRWGSTQRGRQEKAPTMGDVISHSSARFCEGFERGELSRRRPDVRISPQPCRPHPCCHPRASQRCGSREMIWPIMSGRWDSGCNIRDVTKPSQRGRRTDRRRNGQIQRFQAFPSPCLPVVKKGSYAAAASE